MAQTRFYLPSSGAAAVSPAFDAEWENTAATDRLKCVTTRINSTNSFKSTTDATATAFRDTLLRQYVSDPIALGIISGTIKGQIRSSAASGAAAGVRAQLIAKVVSNDGSTVRGVLYAGDLDTSATANPTSEFSQAADTNRTFPRGGPVAISPVVALDTDRVVLELGYRKHVNVTTGNVSLSFMDNNASDLPEDETTTTALNPWIEFSIDLFTPRVRGARSYILD